MFVKEFNRVEFFKHFAPVNMARKRKIPARKHHGIRDPLKQKATQLAKLKGVTNNPPSKGGDQKMSNKFAQFVKLANAAKSGKKIKRIHCGVEDKPKVEKKKKSETLTVSSNKIRPIKQLASESDVDYLRRVNRMTTESLKEAEYEVKYGVTVVRDSKTGAIVIKKKPANEIDELIKMKKSRKPMGKSVPTKIDPKLTKQLIKQAIKEENEESKKESIEEYKRDVFKFGEVVHAPPTITALPRKAVRNETVPRPGKKDNLLLRSMLKDPKKDVKSKDSLGTTKMQKTAKKLKGKLKGKRKDLPAATRLMIEKEQNKVVDLYRQLKKNKQKSFTT